MAKKKQTIEFEDEPPQIIEGINTSPKPIVSNPRGGTGTSPAREAELFPEQPSPTQARVLRNAETGRETGIITPDGRTLLGLQKQDVRKIEGRITEGGQLPTSAEFEQGQAIEAAQETLRTEEQPIRRELDPERIAAEEIPVLGGGVAAGRTAARGILGTNLGIENVPDSELRTLALNKVDRQELSRGLTASEKFGAFVEGIPVAGSIAAKYAGGLIETPSENVQTILKELKTEKTRATNVEIKVKDGTLSQAAGAEIINDIELNIQRMESRMKLLINNSPELKFNSDGVNFIETKILESRERLFQAKINMAAGASSDPSDIAILNSLQGSISAEDFEIPNR